MDFAFNFPVISPILFRDFMFYGSFVKIFFRNFVQIFDFKLPAAVLIYLFDCFIFSRLVFGSPFKKRCVVFWILEPYK